MAISNRVVRLLLSRSGGFCQYPGCQRDLFYFFDDGQISSIEELAHIIAQSQQGPRGSQVEDETQIDEFDNIILLCPNCHTLIDKNPSQFPIELLREWKRNHQSKVESCFLFPVFNSRQELKKELDKLLIRNRTIYDTYGPHSSNNHPLTDAADMWQIKVLQIIIPNNQRIVDLLTVNEALLSPDEKAVVQQFIIHKEAFEYNHVSGDKNSSAPLFPEEMNHILV
jgi:hypothetical protein